MTTRAQRTQSVVRARFTFDGTATRIADHYEAGALRLRLPRPHGRTEAVLLNTGGGIAGGDTLDIRLEASPRAAFVATTQAAVKIYRAEDAPAEITTRLILGDNARLAWLPQETILYDAARLTRSLDVDMASTARLTILEMVVFGRTAHGETVRQGQFRDSWRVRRDGRLVFADDVRLDGAIADTLARPALGGGVRAIATLLLAAPDAADQLDAVRGTFTEPAVEAGASTWNGLLIARFASADAMHLRLAAAAAITAATRAPLPRTWAC